MKIAFKTPPVTHNYSELHLMAEVGHNEISFLIFSQNPFSLEGFYMFSLNRHISPGEYAEALKNTIGRENVLHQQFASCNVFYNQKESVLVPDEYFSEGDKENYCDLIFGQDKTAVCFHDKVKNNDMQVVYRVSEKVFKVLNDSFPKNSFAHSTSVQLNGENFSGNTLECIVYHNLIKIILFKESKVQIVQYFEYDEPTDVCYHLLNVCERFEVPPAAVQLKLSGMVDGHSNLYNEIDKYFLNVDFLPLPVTASIAHKLSEQPHQFYSHLTALAACV